MEEPWLEALFDLGREGLLVASLTALPPLMGSWIAGWLGGLLQALFQVQDPAVGHLPRLLGGLAALALAGPWIAEQWLVLADQAFHLDPQLR